MANAGIGHQPLEVALGQGHKVAHQHTDRGEHRQHQLPLVPTVDGRHEPFGHQPQHQGECRRLGANDEVSRNGIRRPLVHVGGPHVEGHRSHLEPQAHHDEGHAHPEGGTDFGGSGESGGDGVELGNPQGAVDHAHAVEQDRRGEGPNDDVLEAAFVGLGRVSGIGRKHVKTEAQQLQRDVGGEQLPGLGHHVHAQDREKNEPVEFALVFQVGLHEVHRAQDDKHPNAHEDHFEEQGKVVDGQQPVVEVFLLAPKHQYRHSDEGQQSRYGDPRQVFFSPFGDDQVQGEHQEGQARQGELGSQEVQICGEVRHLTLHSRDGGDAHVDHSHQRLGPHAHENNHHDECAADGFLDYAGVAEPGPPFVRNAVKGAGQ